LFVFRSEYREPWELLEPARDPASSADQVLGDQLLVDFVGGQLDADVFSLVRFITGLLPRCRAC